MRTKQMTQAELDASGGRICRKTVRVLMTSPLVWAVALVVAIGMVLRALTAPWIGWVLLLLAATGILAAGCGGAQTRGRTSAGEQANPICEAARQRELRVLQAGNVPEDRWGLTRIVCNCPSDRNGECMIASFHERIAYLPNHDRFLTSREGEEHGVVDCESMQLVATRYGACYPEELAGRGQHFGASMANSFTGIADLFFHIATQIRCGDRRPHFVPHDGVPCDLHHRDQVPNESPPSMTASPPDPPTHTL